MNLTSIKKAVVNVLTLVVTVGPWIANALGAIHVDQDTLGLVTGTLAIAGALLHYLVPNTTTDPKVAAAQSVKLVSAPRSA